MNVDSVDASCGSGVGGADPNWFENTSSANSASGHLSSGAQLGFLDPPGSFNPDSLDTNAMIQERLTPTEPGPIRATLQITWGGDVGGAVFDCEVSLRLTNSCTAFLARYVGNGFLEDPDLVTSCPSEAPAPIPTRSRSRSTTPRRRSICSRRFARSGSTSSATD